MSTGFALPTVITKRVKTLNSGSHTNDVVYTCPSNCVTDLYLSHLYASVLLTISSLVLVRAGGTLPVTKQVATTTTDSNTGTPIELAGSSGGSITENANSNANAIVGTETADVNSASTTGNSTKFGSVIRLFPNDYLVANYNGILSGGELVYSTVEVFGQG